MRLRHFTYTKSTPARGPLPTTAKQNSKEKRYALPLSLASSTSTPPLPAYLSSCAPSCASASCFAVPLPFHTDAADTWQAVSSPAQRSVGSTVSEGEYNRLRVVSPFNFSPHRARNSFPFFSCVCVFVFVWVLVVLLHVSPPLPSPVPTLVKSQLSLHRLLLCLTLDLPSLPLLRHSPSSLTPPHETWSSRVAPSPLLAPMSPVHLYLFSVAVHVLHVCSFLLPIRYLAWLHRSTSGSVQAPMLTREFPCGLLSCCCFPLCFLSAFFLFNWKALLLCVAVLLCMFVLFACLFYFSPRFLLHRLCDTPRVRCPHLIARTGACVLRRKAHMRVCACVSARVFEL